MDVKLWDFWFNHKDSQRKRMSYNDQRSPKIIYFIFDCFTNKFDYLSPSVLPILGYSGDDFTINTLIKNIHHQDELFVFNSEKLCIEFQNTLFYEQHFKYSYKYCFRLKDKRGNYVLVRQSYEALEVNEKGYLAKSIVKLHISELPTDYTPLREVMIFDQTLGANINLNSVMKLSKREREIIELVHKGYTSVEIAEKLFVSKLTIDTHRRNILHKTNSTNFIELLQKIKNS